METLKKIGKISAVVAMIGATMGTAMASNLSDYPSQFIEDGKFNGILVVGSDAKAEDVIGITNIATSLQSAAVTETTTIIDDSLQVSEGYQLCNRNLYPGMAIAECEPSVDESDLDLLSDTVYHDAEGENDNDEKYTEQLLFKNTQTGVFTYAQDDNDAPEANTYLILDNTHAFYTYRLGFDSGVIVNDDSNEEAGDDLEGTTLTVQGVPFTITDVKLSGSSIKQIEAQSGEATVWMSETESIVRIIDGVEHTIELMDVSADATDDSGSCGFDVDGTQVWIDVKDTETVNGVTIGVTDAKRVNLEAQDQDVCEAAFGEREITLVDGDEMKFNNEDVDGTHVKITGSTGGGDFKWTGFDITWANEDGEVYLSPGDEFIDPNFGRFKIVFAGVETRGTEVLEFNAGNNDAEFTFSNEDGTFVKFPFAANAGSQSGEVADEPIFFGNEAPRSSDAQQDELVYLQGEICTGSTSIVDCQGAMFLVVEPTKNEAHIVQISNIDTNDNEANFDDLTYGTSDDDVAYTDSVPSSIALKSAGEIELNFNETAKTVAFVNTGAVDGAEIITEKRSTVTLVNTDTTSQRFEGLLWDEFNDGSRPAGDYASLNITAVYDDLFDNQVEVESSSVSTLTSAVGSGFYDLDEDNDADQGFYTKKGSLILYDNDDNSVLMIEHPYDTAYAEVYIAPTEASVGITQTTETIVNPIAVSSVKIDTEVKDVIKQNIIAVGGPCANSVVAELMGNPKVCYDALGIKSGQALIKLYEHGEYVALVVAGQDAADTRLAAEIVANWEEYDFSGNEMIATTVSKSSLGVESVE